MMIKTLQRCLPVLLAASALFGEEPGPKAENALLAEVYKTGWFEGDCAYHAVLVASDGKVYFTVSSHAAQESAHLYAFDPAAKSVRLLWTVDQTVPKDGSITQGKIHSPLAEVGDELLLGTHDAWYYKDHTNPTTGAVQRPYKGGYVIAVNKQTGKGRIVAAPLHDKPATAWVMGAKELEPVPVEGQALITSICDTKSRQFYAVTWPSGIFLKVDIPTGKVSDYGPQYGGAEGVPKMIPGSDGKPARNPEYQSVQRTLGLDDDGNVYGARASGEIWKYDPKADKVAVLMAKVSDGAGITPHPAAADRNNWRTILWDDQGKAFYGVHWGTSWLFLFGRKLEKVEPVTAWRAQQDLQAPIAKDLAQLGLAMGPNHTLYGLVHANPTTFGGKRSVHLLTYGLETRQFRDHGYLLGTDESVPMFCESCAVAPNGDVYAVAWVLAEPGQRDELKAKRELGPPETRGHGYLMSLIRVPAAQIKVN
jgi:hypothetical protein